MKWIDTQAVTDTYSPLKQTIGLTNSTEDADTSPDWEFVSKITNQNTTIEIAKTINLTQNLLLR